LAEATDIKKPIKALFVLGTRPESIKLAPVMDALAERPDKFIVRLCSTGQHRELFDHTSSLMSFNRDHELNVMRPNQNLYDLTADLISALRPVMEQEKPQVVLVQGDTTSCFAGALAAYYGRAKVAHVEAGLRTFDKFSPYPEEVNRMLTGRLADFHFPPTEQARKNLLAEGIDDANIHVTGNTVIDALLKMNGLLKADLGQKVERSLKEEYNFAAGRPFVLITGHRRENFGGGFENICRAIETLARQNPGYDFVYPVHLNPNVQKPVNETLGQIENVRLLPPLPYETFVYLLARCHIVLTDSGGIQEEAPGLGKPVVVMRDKTERQEAVDSGTAVLAGANAESIIGHVQRLIEDKAAYRKMATAHNPFGDGKASKRIADVLEKAFAP
jgi:UDP-N-acetylglucosamine 2-epimerase (non-hydrolysing)